MEKQKSAFQTPITIKEAIEAVHKKQYLLPAIQREFVWKPEQIIKLFDSLLKGYPIGSFLFWELSKDKIKEFQFYEFIREFHERDSTHNPKANTQGIDKITAILDGQQRLTALYIGLKGTYSYKIRNKKWTNDDAFPKRKLYLNLLSKSEELDQLYNFDFLTKDEANKHDDNNFWFEVGEIMNFESLRDINEYLRDNQLIEVKYAEECLFNLYEVITEHAVINYYQEKGEELDKVLNIFIRTNSGGTKLDYSDLLLSIATAQWKTRDAREEITSFVDELNHLGDGFEFDKDFVLKSSLVLLDFPNVAFKVDNFNAENMAKIEKNWESIEKALKLAIELISTFGYNYQNLPSANAIIPIAYYILSKANPENFVESRNYKEDREKIKKWFALSLIKRVFSGQPDYILSQIRTILHSHKNEFPFDEIVTRFKGTPKAITFNDDDIENLIEAKYGQSHTFSILILIYPTLDLKNRFHIDHIHPRSAFNKTKLKKFNIPVEEYDFYLNNFNYIANLQLLEGIPNEEKSNKDFIKWLEKTYPSKDERNEYMKKHYIPKNISLEFNNFIQFFEERKKLIFEQLKKILL